MDNKELLSYLRSQILEGIEVSQSDDWFTIVLPFVNNSGEPLEVAVKPDRDELILDDLGHVAGMLFQLGQYTEDTPSHQLIKNLSTVYEIDMDYNNGILSKKINMHETSKFLDFIKVMTSIETVLPGMPLRKKERRIGKRLGTRLGNEIKQLRLPVHVQRQIEVQGKHESWIVDYKYLSIIGHQSKDVIIVATDLGWGEPREKAAHVVTLAVDILGAENRKDLRIVYDIGSNGERYQALKAADLIMDNQIKIGYTSYDYRNSEQKAVLTSLIHQELSPFILERNLN